MLNILIKLIILCSLSLSVYANNHITSLVPQKDATNVETDIKVQITFDKSIVDSSIKKNTIKLKTDDKIIEGKLSVKDTNTLVFTPNENLKTGTYSLHVKSIKLENPEPIKPKTWFQKVIFKICSLFYSDVSDCKLYNLFFGNNDIKTKSIKYSFSVNDNIPTIETLTLETIQTELKENTQTTLTIKAIYTDNSTKDITENIEWIVEDSSIITINNTTLQSLIEGTTTVQAKVDNTTSNIINITVYKEINGHKLPPEPNKEENDETVLGIDTNNNIVRDDVERWIYETYDTPVEIGLFMQSARAYQLVIEDPSKAHETVQYSDTVLSCVFYYTHKNDIKVFDKYKYYTERKELKKIQFNSIQRHIAYKRYNSEFNGEILSAPKASEDKCEFDENGVLGELK